MPPAPRPLLPIGFLLLALALAAGAPAQTGGEAAPTDEARLLAAPLIPPEAAERQALERQTPPVKRLSVDAGVNAVTHYVSRGQVFSSRGSIQPWVEIDLPLSAGVAGPVTGVSAFAGNWNSFQAGDPGLGQARTGNRRVLDNWYEADLYAGLRLSLGRRWLTSLRFNFYTSPSDSFRDIHELDWRLRYDDAAHWAELGLDGFSLRPSLRVAKETRDGGGREQWYFSPALRPTYTFDVGGRSLSASVPLVLGFGADGQYIAADGDENHFGFFQTGLTLTAPLNALPDGYGSISVSGGFDVVFVSDQAINFRGNTTEIVGKVGLTYSY